MKHPNVLPFLGVLETETDLYLVSPYAKNGSLKDYIILHPDVDRQRLVRVNLPTRGPWLTHRF